MKIFVNSFTFLILLLIIGDVSNKSLKTGLIPSAQDGPSSTIGPPQLLGLSDSYNQGPIGSPPNTVNTSKIGFPCAVTVICKNGYQLYKGKCRRKM